MEVYELRGKSIEEIQELDELVKKLPLIISPSVQLAAKFVQKHYKILTIQPINSSDHIESIEMDHKRPESEYTRFEESGPQHLLLKYLAFFTEIELFNKEKKLQEEVEELQYKVRILEKLATED